MNDIIEVDVAGNQVDICLMGEKTLDKGKAEDADFGTSDGSRDLPWGSELSDIAGMVKIETDTGLAGVVEFVRPHDVLRIGETELTNIIYSFWHDQLYTVTILID
jgi:hypothetical protein